MPARGAVLYYRLSHSKAVYSLIEYSNGAAKEWHGKAIRWRDRLLEVGDKNQESKKMSTEFRRREGGKLARQKISNKDV